MCYVFSLVGVNWHKFCFHTAPATDMLGQQVSTVSSNDAVQVTILQDGMGGSSAEELPLSVELLK
jgi:hypothetical protein